MNTGIQAQRDTRTPAQQAEYLMNEAYELIGLGRDWDTYLLDMTQNLVESLWTLEDAPSADDVEDSDGYAWAAWMDACPEAFDDAMNALVLLAVVRGNDDADSLIASFAHADGDNDGVWEALAGRYVGTGHILRQYGYLD